MTLELQRHGGRSAASKPGPGRAYRLIGLGEILCAAWSLTSIIGTLRQSSGVLVPWSFLLTTLGLCSLLGLAGVRLLRGNSHGRALSIGIQAAQALQLTTSAFAFRFIAGPQLTLSWLGDRFALFVGVTAEAAFSKSVTDPSFAIGVNLVPVLVILVLLAGHPRGAPEKLASHEM